MRWTNLEFAQLSNIEDTVAMVDKASEATMTRCTAAFNASSRGRGHSVPWCLRSVEDDSPVQLGYERDDLGLMRVIQSRMPSVTTAGMSYNVRVPDSEATFRGWLRR